MLFRFYRTNDYWTAHLQQIRIFQFTSINRATVSAKNGVKWQQKISLFFFLEIILIHQELHIAKIASSP